MGSPQGISPTGGPAGTGAGRGSSSRTAGGNAGAGRGLVAEGRFAAVDFLAVAAFPALAFRVAAAFLAAVDLLAAVAFLVAAPFLAAVERFAAVDFRACAIVSSFRWASSGSPTETVLRVSLPLGSLLKLVPSRP
jgi:hypothetical protein